VVLYRVRIGRDEYLGTPEEVVAFLRRAEGAPPGDEGAYLRAVAERIAERLGVTGIDASDPTAFLESLRRTGVVSVEAFEEPSDRRTSPEDALGDGTVSLGEGVAADDLPGA
jgi:hypothetical protein